MNKEDYVSLEVANLLKEKGYDIKGECYIENSFTNKETYYPKETLYEAAKWLRLNYSINIVVFFYSKELGYGATIQNIKDGKDIGEKVELFDTYEESLNAGILESLKLI